ncbi:MAG: hypothetical protein JSR58_05870 [Verrucomicrobia bacterium]|nr:hypothetical protein [Verrucomicrobiota bacterium]
MEQTNNNVARPPVTTMTFGDQQGALHVADRDWVITKLRFKGPGDDKFREVSIDNLDQDFKNRVFALLESHGDEIKDLTEFTITMEEALGLSEKDLAQGIKSRFILDPRRITEERSREALFTSGKIKCQLCYVKNGSEVRKKFNPKPNDDDGIETTIAFSRALKMHCRSLDEEEQKPIEVPKHQEKKQVIHHNLDKEEETSNTN